MAGPEKGNEMGESSGSRRALPRGEVGLGDRALTPISHPRRVEPREEEVPRRALLEAAGAGLGSRVDESKRERKPRFEDRSGRGGQR